MFNDHKSIRLLQFNQWAMLRSLLLHYSLAFTFFSASRRAILIALVRRDQSFGGLSAWNSWASLAELAARNLLISMMFQSVRQCVWQVSLWLSRSKGARSNDASSSALPRVQAEEIGSALRRIYMYPSSRDSDLFCKIIGN